MVQSYLIKKNSSAIKNPKHMKRNVFIIYSPRHIKIEPASFKRIDTEIDVFLFENSRGLIIPKFNGDKLKKVSDGQHRLWIKILNRSFVDSIVITKNKPFGFLVIEPENLNFKHVPAKKERNKEGGVLLDIKRDNLGGFFPGMILLMLAETLLIKKLKLHPE